jgi:hypothetical protein
MVPRHRATVGSYGGGVSYERAAPVGLFYKCGRSKVLQGCVEAGKKHVEYKKGCGGRIATKNGGDATKSNNVVQFDDSKRGRGGQIVQ